MAGVDAGVVGERRAEHEQQVGLVHDPARDRRAAAAEHAAASGWSSPIWPFALNVVITGAPSCSASAVTAGMWKRAPWPTMITGRCEPRRSRSASSSDSAGGAIAERRDAAGRAARRGALGRRQRLHLVGEDQVRDVAAQQRVLAREVHQLDRVGVVQHRLAPRGDRAERARQVDLLERARAEHLRVDLAGQREHRRAVDLRVPQPGEQVRGAGAGDRQARRGAAGELAVGGRRERRGALVADADVGQPPGLLLAAQRVGEAEVGVPDHPEDVLDAPVDHRLGHHVGDGRRRAARPRRRRTPRRRGSRAGRWSPRRRSRATCRRAGSSRSRATGSAAARSRSSPRRAGRPGAGSGCRAPRTARRSARARRSCGRRRPS